MEIFGSRPKNHNLRPTKCEVALNSIDRAPSHIETHSPSAFAAMKTSDDYDPSGKGVKVRTKESDAVGPICVVLALLVGYFIGVGQGGEQASEWSPLLPIYSVPPCVVAAIECMLVLE
jgi:hypothetical protein